MNIYDAHCHTAGEGDPVLIVHPFLKDAFIDNAIVQQLALQFRVYSITVPGLDGIHPDLPQSVNDHVAFLEDLVKNKFLDSFVLIGISIGAVPCMKYAISHPDHVKKMILISPAGLRPLHPILSFPGTKPVFRACLKIQFKNKKRFHRFLHRLLYRSNFKTGNYLHSEAMKKQSKWPAQAANAIFIFAGKMKEMLNQAHRFHKPVLIIGGSHDKLVPPSAIYYLEGHLQTVTSELIDRAGHLSVLDQPDDYFVKIEQFI
ncbi:alpha/beta hydrolase [bacterium]|nr:alpha/beta hydrolase [bacterium]